jgi:type I restriction enzyme S subunit
MIEVRLGDVAEVIAGQSPPGETYNQSGVGLPFFQGKADFGRRHPVVRVWCSAPERIAEPGDVLISVRAPVGPTNVADVRCCIGRGLAAIRARDGLDRDFLLHALRSRESNLKLRGSGSTFESITSSDLVNLKIPITDLPDQRTIAALLSNQLNMAHQARLVSKERFEHAATLRAATITAAFGPDADIARASLSSHGSLTDGDWILNSDYAPAGVRLLQVGDVGRGNLVIKSRRFITPERARELNCTFLEPGDILISRMAEPIGRACVLPDLGYPAITAVDVTILRVSSAIERDFLATYMESEEWLATVAAQASGATRPRISRKNLEALRVPVPPLAEQKRMAAQLRARLATIDATTRSIESELATIKALPAALLRRAFEGVAA